MERRLRHEYVSYALSDLSGSVSDLGGIWAVSGLTRLAPPLSFVGFFFFLSAAVSFF